MKKFTTKRDPKLYGLATVRTPNAVRGADVFLAKQECGRIDWSAPKQKFVVRMMVKSEVMAGRWYWKEVGFCDSYDQCREYLRNYCQYIQDNFAIHCHEGSK